MRPRFLSWALCLVMTGASAWAADEGTKLLRFPDIWQDQVVFCHGGDLWLAPAAGGTARRLTAHPGQEVFPRFSPDGRWIAYQSNASGKSEVYLTTFPEPGGTWQVSQAGGAQPMWRRDGAALYFRSFDGKLMEASVEERGPAVVVGTPRELFQAQLGGFPQAARVFAVPPTGDRFLVMRSQENGPSALTLVTNWTAGLRR